jgi:23S rRNA pseudouridine1911/1915/1917 synthase
MDDPQIIFQDTHLLIINKPAGMVVNRAKSAKGGTVQEWIEERFKIQNTELKTKLKIKDSKFKTQGPNMDWDAVNRQAFYDRSGVAHRLDKETSGVLTIAKTPDVFVDLLRQFRVREVEKTYLALVHGKLETSLSSSEQYRGNKKFETISAPIGRLPWNRTRFGVLPNGRKAVTKYKVLRYFKSTSPHIPLPKASLEQALKGKPASWQTAPFRRERQGEIYTFLELKPETGRTHQLRVHLKHINHPIVSDPLYVGRKTARADRRWCQRLFLHAHILKFTHPHTGRKIKHIAELPVDLLGALKTLEPI